MGDSNDDRMVGETVMRQVSEHRWSFEPPDEAPMLGFCESCKLSRVVRQPRVMDTVAGRYVVEGTCKVCGSPVRLQVP